ncbi:MAG: PQQ-dependent sugar dehydrogenase [Chitinophagaceae bacterium]
MALQTKNINNFRNKRKALFVWLPVTVIIAIGIVYYIKNRPASYQVDEKTLAKGKDLFSSQCRSCHGISEEGIGPRLGGVTLALSEESLIRFIHNPSKVMEAGDKRAKILYKQYKQLMPSFDFMKRDDIHSILAYIDNETRIAKIEPLKIDTANDNAEKERYAPPVKNSGLTIELQEYIKVPRADSNPPDKGIATLRTNPAGDGSIFVSDQMGVIFRIEKSKADTFLDVRLSVPDFISTPGIGTGLGSFAFHPDFIHNGLIYTTYAEQFIGKPTDFQFADTFKAGLQWVLSEWKINDIKARKFMGTRRELLRINTPTTAHGAQDLSFAPTLDKKNPDYGMLFLGIGDGGSNNIKRPDLVHNKQSLLGTVIRINPLGRNSKNGHYGIPPDNPFANDSNPGTRKEIWAYGFRNPHRLAWDINNDKTRMLVADIGESNIEEINVIEKGKDYGWPVREGNYGIATKINLKKVYYLKPEELSLYHAPFAQYDHTDGNAISGGYVYEGRIQVLKNKYVFGDIATGKLFYVNLDGHLSDSAVYELSIAVNNQLTDLKKLNNTKRVHLRMGYDPIAKELFIMTKNGIIRKVTDAYIKK